MQTNSTVTALYTTEGVYGDTGVDNSVVVVSGRDTFEAVIRIAPLLSYEHISN